MNKGLDRTFLEYDLKLNEESQDVIFKYLTSMKQTYDKAKQGAEDQEHIRLHGDAGTGSVTSKTQTLSVTHVFVYSRLLLPCF